MRGLVGLLMACGVLSPAFACGPFLYDNADLDRFSFLEPGILNNQDWVPFLAFASPPFGFEGEVAEPVVAHLVKDYDPGEDPVSVAANEAWWVNYFRQDRQRQVSVSEVQGLLYGTARPRWLVAADRLYFDQLRAPADDAAGLKRALAQARNPENSAGLRHRWAFWAVRALALKSSPRAVEVFREFCPNQADDLPLARAQGWAASVVARTEPATALDLWLDLLVRWPALRAQTFSSLASLEPAAWTSRAPEALVARFFLQGRDFSPETLEAVAQAEHRAGRDGSWTEAVLFSMAEQIEGEAGVFALFGLVDPEEQLRPGLFTGLVDRAEALVALGVQPPTRTWWLLASYLCLFDGDQSRAARLLDRARSLPESNSDQAAQTEWLDALVKMGPLVDRDWPAPLQEQVVRALAWGRSLDGPGHNRGLYHSVAVLAAQKALARGQRVEAVLAFGLVQAGPWANPYRVRTDDEFWAVGWQPNNPVTALMDAMMTDTDLMNWGALLKGRSTGPLSTFLASRSFLTDRDLVWWQAYRALRRGRPAEAQALLSGVSSQGLGTGFFPARTFSFSLDLDPLDPASGRGMRAVPLSVLAAAMAGVEEAVLFSPTAKNHLAKGMFWFSLQLSGFPLLFAQPPAVISFVNGNFEYYGYDGRDVDRTSFPTGSFPLRRSEGQQTQWRAFYQEFSTLDRARTAFEAVLARGDDPTAEFQALLFLQALDGHRMEALASPRYDALPLAREFRATCEAFLHR